MSIDKDTILAFYAGQTSYSTPHEARPATATPHTSEQLQADEFADMVISYYRRLYPHTPAEVWDNLQRQIITPVEATQPHGGLTPSQAAERTTAMQSIADRIIQAEDAAARTSQLQIIGLQTARLGAHTTTEDNIAPPSFAARAHELATELMRIPHGDNIGRNARVAFYQWQSTHTSEQGLAR